MRNNNENIPSVTNIEQLVEQEWRTTASADGSSSRLLVRNYCPYWDSKFSCRYYLIVIVAD